MTGSGQRPICICSVIFYSFAQSTESNSNLFWKQPHRHTPEIMLRKISGDLGTQSS